MTTPRFAALSLAVALLLTERGITADPPVAREAWTTSRLVGSPDPPPPYKAVNAFPNVKLKNPVLMTRLPGSDRLFVAEQAGKILSFKNEPNAKADLCFDTAKEIKSLAKTPNASEVEAVYGLAFHPKFAANRTCFVCYTVKGKTGNNLPEGTRVSRFRVLEGEIPRIDPASEEIVLTYLQGGHNGGDLHFGPDGFLYISTGDAATPSPPDVLRTGQDITDLLSSILRIDVDRKDEGKHYAVPKDNPFVGLKIGDKLARPEVWAYGFRNPWRMSFDRKTGELWVGDVGWELFEMVYKVEKGGNYGWSAVEGRQPINATWPVGPTPILPPMIEISHTDGASVTGGYVYRGKKFPELVGTYIFGDWVTRRIWSAKSNGIEEPKLTDIVAPSVRVVAFGEDNAGELYFLDYDNGTIRSLEKNLKPAIDPAKFPKALSETGLVADAGKNLPAKGVYPFKPVAKQWQDFATSQHWVALPGTSAVTDYEGKKPLPGAVSWLNYRYHFPKDAVLVKTLSLDTERGEPSTRKRIETQVLHFDGEDWHPYTYAWRDDQTDADLVPADGGEKTIRVIDPTAKGGVRDQTWTFTSRAQCLTCHNQWAETALAFNPDQLNREIAAPGGKHNQLTRFGELGLLNRVDSGGKAKPPLAPEEAVKTRKLIDPQKSSLPLAERAKAYLHANCGHCHRNGGGGSVDLELHAEAKFDSPKLIDAKPLRGTFDLIDPRIVTAGKPSQSTLFYRMAKFGSGRMPHLGSELPDPQGLALIREWIASLPMPNGAASRENFSVPSKVRLDEFSMAMVVQSSIPRSPAFTYVAIVNDPYLPLSTRVKLFEALVKLPPGPVRDLFEGHLTPTGADRKLGTNPRPKSILALTGDPVRGKEFFFAERSRCALCHKVDGQGTDLGPDLSAIGKTRSPEHLLESLLDPSRKIEPAYQPYLVKTSDGRALTGLLVKRDAKELVLKDNQAKEIRIPAADVELVVPSRESLMPRGALADLTPQQAADLLAYLVARK